MNLIMSPLSFNNGWANVFFVNSNGWLNNNNVNATYGVRPVINLRADVTISGGNGTANNPYQIGK